MTEPEGIRRVIIDDSYSPPPLTLKRLSKIRDMSAEDKRRTAIEASGATIGVIGVTDPRLVIVEKQPEIDPVTGEPLEVIPWDRGDGHRGLQHNDGKGEVRPPREFEDERAEWSYWTHVERRVNNHERLLREREAMPLAKRLADAEAALTKLQTPKAQTRRETDAKSGLVADHAPSGEGEFAVAYFDRDELALCFRRIGLQLEIIEEAIDVHNGVAIPRNVQEMGSEEKDALITSEKFEGLHVKELAALYPELGVEQTLRRVRAAAGQDVKGLPKRERKAGEG